LDYKWATIEEMSFLDFAQADLPIIELLS
jgi:hypothetical protein